MTPLWLARLLPLWSAIVSEAADSVITSVENPHVMVSNGENQAACDGYEEEDVPCPAKPACTACTPVNCQYGQWGEWDTAGAGSCNQICTRKRVISKHNNECGQGCNSTTSETKRCSVSTCVSDKTDCEFSHWSTWSICQSDFAQKERSRSIKPASHGGLSCTGSSKQTFPCGMQNLPVNCKFSTWHEWTDCSASCGQGQRTRTRRWAQEAQHGGMPCNGALQAIAECMGTPCAGAQNCVVAAWSPWVGCTAEQTSQKFRTRQVQSPNRGGGTPCPENIKETLGCPARDDTCQFSAWLGWTACDRVCGGGQMRRSRTLLAWLETKNMSKCPDAQTQETMGCNPQLCVSASDNCILAAWSEWAPCRPQCGSGMSDRQRKVQQEAKPDGVGCVGALEELRPCNSPACAPRDCVWGLWSQWGACTATCNGGTHRRVRTIALKPRHGGKACNEVAGSLPAQKWPWSQVAPCNVLPCNDQCINGTWGMWGAWSVCSATCDTGFRSRRRDLAQVPNACGHPAEGPENEVMACQPPTLLQCVPKVDCKLSLYSDWSPCSKSCFGTQERQRLIERFASGMGAQCTNSSLKEIRPCNPVENVPASSSCSVLPHHDCTMTTWGQWADCPVSCGGGQHTRARRIIQPPSGGGKSCLADLTMTRSCNKNKCGSHCINCKWGQWDNWGACSKCGGQRYRTRRVEQLPNHCGTACLSRTASETAACPDSCEPAYWCAWAGWSAFTSCSGTCGNVTKQRQRQLQILRVPQANGTYLFKSHKNLMCAGTQFEVNLCPGLASCAATECTPVNCQMGAWGTWGAPQLTGLCQRNRVIAANNNQCGTPCAGNLVETKVCIPTSLKPRDCQLSTWGQWSHCPSMLAQRYKVRGVFRQAANGGVSSTCDGALRETVSCRHANTPIDCGLTDWTVWGACTRSCGGGWRYRTRQANHPPQQFGGTPCAGGLKEIGICSPQSCQGADVDCSLGPWSTFGVCFNEQKSRFRGIQREASGLRGQGCKGALEDTLACGGAPVNCKVSPWTAWDACDLSCGGGQQNRHRTIWKHPLNGGTPCPMYNKMTQGCNRVACTGAKNCILSQWAGWGPCDTDCGIGQKNRVRTITQLRSEGGTGCLGDLEESTPCGTVSNTPCPVSNCTWGLWSHWSHCSKECGTGFQSRDRVVKTPAGPGGQPCSANSMTQSAKCNTKSCSGQVCIDGQWNEWGAWGECSATCGGGVQWRSRNVKSTANFCGKALVGETKEAQSCNDGVAHGCADNNKPCVFNEWKPWSACDQACNGVTERTRDIKTYGTGTGAGCNGTLKDIASCNPALGEARPANCPAPLSTVKIDCNLNQWQAWGQCTHTCGGGVKIRNRTIATQAANGGKGCTGSTQQANPCNHQLCPGSQASVNCKWGQWTPWGNCDHCAGKQTRQRQVIRHGLRGGKVCTPGESEQVQICDVSSMPAPFMRYCGVAKFCSWDNWGAWGACSANCGNSTKTRRRNLKATDVDPYTTTSTTTAELRMRLYDDDMKDVMAMRQVRVAKQGQTHAQELAMAFAAGGASLFLFMAAMRAYGSRQVLPDHEGIQMADPEPAFGSSSRSPLVGLE